MRLAQRLILRRYGIAPEFVLNRGPEPHGATASLAADLRQIMGVLTEEGFDDATGRVDYPRLQISPIYAEYRQCAARLQSFDAASLVDDQERLAFSLGRLDPRIHFALVCAARSCPRITAYEARDINAQLDLAARTFIHGGGVQVDQARGQVRLSRIFQWYAPDFGARRLGLGDRAPLLRYVSAYLGDKASRDYVLGGRPRVRFMRYDWSLNQ